MEKVNEYEKEYREGDHGVKYMFRGPRTDWGVILMLPDDRLGAHFHQEVEETFYLVEGTVKFYVNEQEYQATAGDAFRLEPEDRHDIWNDSDEPAKFVFIKCPYLPQDKVTC
jgi:quercetin dioxygenase-like cupin family protein